MIDDDLKDAIARAQALEKYPLARLISVFENRAQTAATQRIKILEVLGENERQPASIIGFTGTPGAGKSTLIGAVCEQLLASDPDLSVAVLAVDPSSHVSGGAILGDRTRVRFPLDDPRVFFRSQASNLEYGGVSMATFQVCRLLRRLFDLVVIETVGIGQSETDIQRIADHSLLVMQPLAGDQIQFMKAGIMEIPDAFIVNKCDAESAARQSLAMLRSSLKLGKVVADDEPAPPIFATSATERRGIDQLAEHMLKIPGNDARFGETEHYYFERWLRDEFGRRGVARWTSKHPAAGNDSFETRQLKAIKLLG